MIIQALQTVLHFKRNIQNRLLYTRLLYIRQIFLRVPSICKSGIPGYGLRTELTRNFFSFPSWKRFQKFESPEQFSCDFFPRPEIFETLFRNYETFRNIVPENSGLRKNCFGIFREKVL